MNIYRSWTKVLSELLEAILIDSLELDGAYEKSYGQVKKVLQKARRARKLSGLSKSSENLLDLVDNSQPFTDVERGLIVREMTQLN